MTLHCNSLRNENTSMNNSRYISILASNDCLFFQVAANIKTLPFI